MIDLLSVCRAVHMLIKSFQASELSMTNVTLESVPIPCRPCSCGICRSGRKGREKLLRDDVVKVDSLDLLVNGRMVNATRLRTRSELEMVRETSSGCKRTLAEGTCRPQASVNSRIEMLRLLLGCSRYCMSLR